MGKGLIWVLDKAMAAPPKPAAWYENTEDPEALERVYGAGTSMTPGYEYPAFIINAQECLEAAPDCHAERYKPFKDQFNILCDKLVELRPNSQNEINTFRAKLLCGYENDTSSKYSHQEAGTFAEMKLNLEIILNQIIKNKDEVTIDQLIYTITVCEGGAYQDLDRLKKTFTEPRGIAEFLEKERVRIVDAIAQIHIEEAARLNYIIQLVYHAHVPVLFTEALIAFEMNLPPRTLRDIHIPVVELKVDRRNEKYLVFADHNNERIAHETYHIDNNGLNNIPKKFYELYTPSIRVESLAAHLNEKLVILFNQYQTSEGLLATKLSDIKNEKSSLEHKLNEQQALLDNHRKNKMYDEAVLSPIRQEKERLKNCIFVKEEEMVAPWTKFLYEVTKLLLEYKINDFDLSNILSGDTTECGSKLALKSHSTRMNQLFAAAATALSQEGYITGIDKNPLKLDVMLTFAGKRAWIEDEAGRIIPLEILVGNVDVKNKIIQYIEMCVDRGSVLAVLNMLIATPGIDKSVILCAEEKNKKMKEKHNSDKLTSFSSNLIFESSEDLLFVFEKHNNVTARVLEYNRLSYEQEMAILQILVNEYDHESGTAQRLVRRGNYFVARLINKYSKVSKNACMLLAGFTNSSSQLVSLLCEAINHGWPEAVAFILKHNPGVDMEAYVVSSPNGGSRTYLMAAVEAGNLHIVNLFINFIKPDPQQESFYNHLREPMIIALKNGRGNIVRAFLKLNYNVYAALNVAVIHNCAEMVSLIVNEFIDLDIARNSPALYSALSYASEEGFEKIVTILIQKGVVVNLCDAVQVPNLNTPALFGAAKHGHTTIVKMLIDAGADVNEKNIVRGKPQISPIGAAILNEHRNAAILLFASGAKVSEEMCTYLLNDESIWVPSNLYLISCLLEQGGALPVSDLYIQFLIENKMIHHRYPALNNTKFYQQCMEFLANARQEFWRVMPKEAYQKLAFTAFDDLTSPHKDVLAMASKLMHYDMTPSYHHLMQNPKIHTLSAFYGHTLLCDLIKIQVGSYESLKLYANVMLSRIKEKCGEHPDPSSITKIAAFTEVITAEGSLVRDKLAQALDLERPRYSRIFSSSSSSYIPEDTPADITTILKSSFKRENPSF